MDIECGPKGSEEAPRLLSLHDFVVKETRELHRHLKRFVCPVFTVDDSDVLRLLGSGVLLRVGSLSFLVTAAHVLDESANTQLYVWGQAGPIALDGNEHLLVVPDRSKDKFDFSFVRLADDVAAELELKFAFLEPADLNVNDGSDNQGLYGLARYMFIGYPASRNRPIPIGKFKLSPIMAALFPAEPEKYRRLGLNTRTHVAAKFEMKRLVNQNGAHTGGCKPNGMSGGGVWFVGEAELVRNSLRPRLAAIFIEYPSSEQVFVAVRISLVISALVKAYPDTAPLLPQPRLVAPRVEIVPRLPITSR